MNSRILAVMMLGGAAIISAISFSGFSAQDKSRHEDGTVLVHHLERLVGQEHYQLTSDEKGVLLNAALDFTDRGNRIQLTSTLQLDGQLVPIRFQSKGRLYRFVNIDTTVNVLDGIAEVGNLSEATQTEVPNAFFTARGYAPFAGQALMVRYWERHGRPAELNVVPGYPVLHVAIRYRGTDSVRTGNRSVRLRRYSVDGLVWGRETLWLDEQNRFSALLTRIHILPLEAVREDLEDALPELQTIAIADRISDLAGFGQQIPPVAQGEFALVGGRLYSSPTEKPIENATVHIRDGRIVSAGPSSSIRLSNRVRVIPAQGKTIIPGLWDMHAHASQIEWAPAYLAAGVTTIRDMGGEKEFLTAFRDALSRNQGPGPQILLAGLIEGPGTNGYGRVVATTPAEGRAIVDSYHGANFNQIKLYSLMTHDLVSAISSYAHDLGMTVTGHVPNALSINQAVESGMDQFAHLSEKLGAPGSIQLQQTIQLLATHGTVVDPTIAWNELLERAPETALSSFEPGILMAPGPIAMSYNSVKNNTTAAEERGRRRSDLDVVKAMHDRGVRIVAGTDGAVPGHSLLREIELYVQAGMSPAEALNSATLIPAKVMQMDKYVGSIETGKRADLLVLDADPLANISNIRKGRWTVANGRLYDCFSLWQIAGFLPRR
jgi:imidazolonepropionase-like amidohydrolase